MANIPELAAGRLSLFADTVSVGRSIGKVFDGGDKHATKAGARWGKLMSKSFDKTKPDMDKLADDVTKATKRIEEETKRSDKAMMVSKAKLEAAQAKYNEAVEKSGRESGRAKQAAVALMTAQNNLEKQTLDTTRKLDKLNEELAESKDAYQNGVKAADAYTKGWKGLGNKLRDQVRNAFDKNLDQSKRARSEGDTASDAYASGWSGLGAKLTNRTVGAVIVAGVAATAMARFQGQMAGNAYANGFGAGIGRLSGGRVIGDTLSDFGEWVGNLDKSSPKIALVSSSILTLSGAVIGATGNVLSLVGSILSIGPAALTLPGILMAGGVAAGIFIAAISDAGTQLERATKRFTELGDKISSAVWKEAAKPINDLADSVVKNLTDELLGASTAMGSLAAAFAVEIQGTLPNGELAGIVNYLEESLWNAHAAVAPLTESLMTLGIVGASYMPVLSNWIVRIATDFNAWLQQAEADGRLKKWIDDGIQGMKDLGSVVYFTTAVFATLTRSLRDAGFDATLGGLANSLERINTALQGPVGQGVLANVFGGARAALDGVYEGVFNLSNSFVQFAPTLERIMSLSGQFFGTLLTHLGALLENPVFAGGLRSFFENALTAVEAFSPAMEPLAEMFGVLAQTVGLFLANMAPVISEIFAKLAPVFADLLIAIQPLIPVLAETLLAAFMALMPHIETLAVIFAEKVVPLLIELCHWIIENAHWLAPLIVTVIGLAVALAPLISGFITLLPAIIAVAPVLGSIVSAAAPVIAIIGLLVISVIGMWYTWNRIWNWVKRKVIEVATWIVVEALPWIAEKIAWLSVKWEEFKNKVVSVWNVVRSKIAEVATWFMGKVNDFKNKITELMLKFELFKIRVSATWNAFKNMLLNGYNSIKTRVIDKLSNAVKNTLPNAFQKAKDSIARIWSKLSDVVKNPIRTVLRDILQNGLIAKVNGILDNVDKKKTIARIPRVWPLPGFRDGGYTGKKRKDEVAGVVHGDEQVIRSESRRSIERTAPGFLDRLNKGGASALPSFGHEGHTHSEGMAAGGPGGPGTYLWGGLQNAIYAAGRASLAGSIPGVDMGAVARAWNNMSNLRITRGSGPNQITGRGGSARGNWGYATSDGQFEISPSVPGGMRTPVAIHEVGHVLGLDHAGANSIMHPMMAGPTWPSGFDRQSIQRIYGGSGKGNPPEGGGGFLSSITNWLSSKLDPLTGFVSGIGSMFTSKLPDGGLFADMAKAVVSRITDKIGDLVKDKIKGFFGGDDEGASARGKLPLYDNGGFLPKGRSLVENKTGKVEPILTDEQWRIQEKNAEIVSTRTENGGQTIINVEREKGEDGYELGNKIGNRLAFQAARI